MNSGFVFLGALCALLAVAMGAFGAHALKTILSPEMLTTYQTAVTYQMWHALGLLVVGLLRQQTSESFLLTVSGLLMLCGIVLFSGSLYGLTLLNDPRLGIITPFGGGCFLLAWLLIAIFTIKKQPESRYNNNARR